MVLAGSLLLPLTSQSPIFKLMHIHRHICAQIDKGNNTLCVKTVLWFIFRCPQKAQGIIGKNFRL